ncbi:MAG: SDR family NAD(P)-dependent oxidoreductase [Ignavibacteria bacterium]|nr:SDR family NAD(P)-dependent oxidoreductase [Ignavibacteria bacterium]
MKENKIVIITGGTGGLGRHVASKFAAAGCKVYLPVTSLKKFTQTFDNSQEENSEFSLRKIFAFECDALNETAVNEFVANVSALEKGRIDVLVNTVGGIHDEVKTADIDMKEFDKWFNLNFRTTLLFTKAVLKSMIQNNFGRIISIGSTMGLNPVPGRLAYSISKSALTELMELVSKEYKKFNIRANTIVPSVIDTPANREWGTEEEIKKWVKPSEIANVIFELAGEKFNSVTQSTIKVFGNF